MVEFFQNLTFRTAILVGLAIAGLYYFLIYDDGSNLDNAIKNKNIEYGLKEQEKVKLNKNIEEGIKLKEKVEIVGGQFKEAFEFLPTVLEAEKLISDITKQAQVSGATVVKITPVKDREKEKDGIYESMGIDIELKGTFSSLTLFIANISKIKRILEVDQLAFTNGEEDVESPTLNLNGRIVGYRYITPEEQRKPENENK